MLIIIFDFIDYLVTGKGSCELFCGKRGEKMGVSVKWLMRIEMGRGRWRCVRDVRVFI